MGRPSRFSRYDITEDRIAARIKEGRGTGRGSAYIPWIQASDISSHGLTSRVPGRLTGRIHHLLSSLELRAFLDFEFSGHAVDIREQFPLDRDETRRIADLLGFKHPRPPKTDVDIVMTTDFLLTISDGDGGTREEAVSVKYSDEFDRRRVRQKFEIERRYWELRDVPFNIYTEEDSSVHREVNLRSLKAHEKLEPVVVEGRDRTADVTRALLRAIETAPKHLPISSLWQRVSASQRVPQSHLPNLFLHLAANGVIMFDLDRRFDVTEEVGSLAVRRLAA